MHVSYTIFVSKFTIENIYNEITEKKVIDFWFFKFKVYFINNLFKYFEII
jgi:hypothetical protein